MKKDIKITVNITNDDLSIECEQIKFKLEDGAFEVRIYYDFKEEPLVLRGQAKKGDHVEIVLMSFRTELWINGILADEEWPAGERLFDETKTVLQGCKIEKYEYVKREELDIIGTFKNAEGWRPEGNVFVGDCMPYVNNGRYHVLYLKDRHHHRSKWGFGAHQWNHISTKDFSVWQIHPAAVEITDSREGSICTGSWIKAAEKEYLFYTVRMANASPAPIKRSVSDDGYHYKKDEQFGFFVPDKYEKISARDPKVIRDKKGKYHMFVTTSLKDCEKGCLAHFVSDNLDDWYDFGKPMYVSADQNQPECPDFITFNGKNYLIFSIKGTASYVLVGDDFKIISEEKQIEDMVVPKGAVFGDEIIFTGFRPSDRYASDMTFRHYKEFN